MSGALGLGGRRWGWVGVGGLVAPPMQVPQHVLVHRAGWDAEATLRQEQAAMAADGNGNLPLHLAVS